MNERHTIEVKGDFPSRASLSTLCPNTANTATFGAGSKFTFTTVDRKGGRFVAPVEEGEETPHAMREGKVCEETPFHHRLPRKAMAKPFESSAHDGWTITPTGKSKDILVRQTETYAASPPIPSPLPPFMERTRSIHTGKGRKKEGSTRPSRGTRPVSPAVQKFLASRQALQEKIFHDERSTLLTMEAHLRASIVQKEEKERMDWRGRDEKWNVYVAGAMRPVASLFGAEDDVGAVSSSAQGGERYRRGGHRRDCTATGAPCRTPVDETLSEASFDLHRDSGQQTQEKERVEILLATIAKLMDARPPLSDPVDSEEEEERGGPVRHQTRRPPPRSEKWDLPEKTLRHSWEAAQEECDGRAAASAVAFSHPPSPPVQASVPSAEGETRLVTESRCHQFDKDTHGHSGVATPSSMKRQERWTAIPHDRRGFSSHSSMASSELAGSSVLSPRAPEATATCHPHPFMEDIGVEHNIPSHVQSIGERWEEERRPANLPSPPATPLLWTAPKAAPQDQLVVPSSDAGVMVPTTDDASPAPPKCFSLRRILNVFLPQSVPYLFLIPLILVLRLLRVDWFLVTHVLWPFGWRTATRQRG